MLIYKLVTQASAIVWYADSELQTAHFSRQRVNPMIALLILACSIVNEEPAQNEATAKPPSLELLNTLVTLLGYDAFSKSEAAEKQLMEVDKAILKEALEGNY
jgi:hypothetical protein